MFSEEIFNVQLLTDIDEFIMAKRMAAYVVPDYHAEFILSQLKPIGDEQPAYRVLDTPFSEQTSLKYFKKNPIIHASNKHPLNSLNIGELFIKLLAH